MTYIFASALTRDKHDIFLKWLEDEDIDPTEVVDNGRFSVHNGRISGDKFIRTPEGLIKVHPVTEKVVLVPFHQAQKHPLPEELA